MRSAKVEASHLRQPTLRRNSVLGGHTRASHSVEVQTTLKPSHLQPKRSTDLPLVLSVLLLGLRSLRRAACARNRQFSMSHCATWVAITTE